MTHEGTASLEARQRRRARRNAVVLGSLALLVYLGYMLAIALQT